MNEMQYTLDYLYDPTVYAVGRLEATSDHDVYRSAAEAQMNASSLVTSLNGLWKFAYSETPDKRPIGFESPDADVSGWRDIRVPAHIELQGYGKPQYVNIQYPWDGHEQLDPPAIPRLHNPVGSYVRFFDCGALKQGERATLRFEGVDCAFYCWLNGAFLGYSEDSCTPASFDVTDALTEGENRLAVEVYRFSTATWLEDQDFFRLSGIYRDVELIIHPRAHVRDIFVHTELSDDFSSAELAAELKLDLPAEGATARVLLIKDGAEIDAFETAAEAELTVKRHIDAPLLWSAEEPNLYELRVALISGLGDELEVASTRVGFRRIEIANGIMLLNGKRILLHGVDRHEFCAESGRALPRELMLKDVLTMKRNNINAVRTSHYPNHPYWYKLCDEYGIYLIDECNLETHGTWLDVPKHGKARILPGDYPEWLPAVLDRARSMQERDKNHPSVIIWSCGNESCGGKDIFEMSELMRRRDPSRPIHYEGVINDRTYNDTSDIESQMYTRAKNVRAYLDAHTDKPFILCEYAHAMGNSVGALHKYTELENLYPQYQGAFIWDYVDQALYLDAPSGKRRLGYGGDFGDRPSDREFSGNGLVFADHAETPKLQEVKYLYQDVTIAPDESGVTLTNRYLFKSTAEFALRWTLLRDGEPVQTGVVDAPDVPAGETRRFELPIAKPTLAGEYCLHCGLYPRAALSYADTDCELMHGEAVIADIAHTQASIAPDYAVIEGDCNIGAHGAGYEVQFNKPEGGLCSLRGDDKRELLCTAPMLSLFRAPTSNDAGNHDDRAHCLWLAASLYGKGEYKRFELAEGVLTAHFRHELPLADGAAIDVTYTVLGRGRVRVDMDFAGKPDLPDLPAFGMSLRLPVELDRVSYYGLGPDECYADRRMGAKLGIHEYLVADNLTPYLKPQECGAREGVRWLTLTDADGRGLRVERVSEPLSVSVLDHSAFELLQARHIDELAAPSYTYLDIALKRQGVGGDDSWGAPVHPEYHIPADKPIKLSFVLSVAGVVPLHPNRE